MALFNFRAKRTGEREDSVAVTEPRPHHYEFAHEALPAFAFESPADMLDVFTGPDAQEFLDLLWQRVGESLPARERLPGRLAYRTWKEDGQVYVIVTLPPPMVATEAWCAALFFDNASEPPNLRYFVLEYGAGDPPGTVLAERNAELARHNLGAGPVPDAEALHHHLRALLKPSEDAGESVQPCQNSVFSIGDNPPVLCGSCHQRFESEALMQSEIELLHSQLICREFEAELDMLRRVRELYDEHPELEGAVIPAAIGQLGNQSTQMRKNLEQGLAYAILRAGDETAEALPPGVWTTEEEEVLRFLQTHYFRLEPRLEFVAQQTEELMPLLKRRLNCLNCSDGRLFMQPRDY